LNKFIAILLLGLSSPLFSLEYSGSLYSRYGENVQTENEFTYIENFLTLNLQGDTWDIVSEFAYNEPPEYGVRFSGIRTLSLNIIRDSWSMDAGHLNGIFGNGLAFNFFEDKSLDFDNRPFGLRIDFELNEQVQLMTLFGTRDEFTSYSPSANRTPDLFTNFDVGGIQVNYFPDNGSWNGAGYITGSKFRSPVRIESLNIETLSSTLVHFPEQEALVINGGLTYTLFLDDIEWNLEYGVLKKWFDYPLVKQEFDGSMLRTMESTPEQSGNVFYSQLISSFPDNSILSLEYKMYQNGIESIDNKININRLASKSLPFNLGPTSLRQHDIGLLANLTHVVDYGDEIGFNVDYRKNLNESFLFTGIYAQASRTSIDGVKTNEFIPNMAIDYFPFHELYLDLEYSGNLLQNRMVLAYTEFSIDGITKEKYTTFIPTYFSKVFGKFVFSGSIGMQKAFKDKSEYVNQQYILSADWMRKISIALISDITSDPSVIGDAQWISGEIAYKPSPALTFRSSYGTEKGGVRCTGGVCRYISPFDGVRLMMEIRL